MPLNYSLTNDKLITSSTVALFTAKTVGVPMLQTAFEAYFQQNFIVYESNCTELLLGFNFIKTHGIAIYPNLGLIFESQLRIYNIQEQINLKCSLKMCRDTTINGDAQQVVKVYLSDIPPETNKQIYVHETWPTRRI